MKLICFFLRGPPDLAILFNVFLFVISNILRSFFIVFAKLAMSLYRSVTLEKYFKGPEMSVSILSNAIIALFINAFGSGNAGRLKGALDERSAIPIKFKDQSHVNGSSFDCDILNPP
ncbi:hypothetical protein LEP1GSC170_1201 [Leptospira interrogans serovar Bataviae str. HAI135]|nr:hypothetical protein LEP1GSC170_1201 [Leptospira interrogans serovar Bataviae str. HAI135]